MDVTRLIGADAAYLPPAQYRKGFSWFGVYVGGIGTDGKAAHVWTPNEVKALHDAGVPGFLPIVGPPISWPWVGMPVATSPESDGEPDLATLEKDGEETVLRELVSQAQAWGVKPGEPLCLDIEQKLADLIGTNMASLLGTWWNLAHEEAGFEPWVYGSATTLSVARKCRKWLARWSFAAGQYPSQPPDVPYGYDALQYAGRLFGDVIDLDVANGPRTFAATSLTGPVVLGGSFPPVPPGAPTVVELLNDVENAIHAVSVAISTAKDVK